MYGVARDISAMLDLPLSSFPDSDLHIKETDALFRVESQSVLAYDALIGEVNAFAKPPLYMVNRLRQAGMGLNHAVVDVLNYVMLELGQPMHAFDQSTLSLPLVMQNGSSQSFELLNNEQYHLKNGILVCDQMGHRRLRESWDGFRMQSSSSQLQLESAIHKPLLITKKKQATE